MTNEELDSIIDDYEDEEEIPMTAELAIECIETQKQFTNDLTNKAFDMAISALKGGWIPITYRPATAEELEGTDYTEGNIFTCEMPEDGETVYITTDGEVVPDTFRKDGFDSYFEDNGIEYVEAWHKKPEPYKKGDKAE